MSRKLRCCTQCIQIARCYLRIVRLRKRKVTYAVLGVPPHVFGYVVAPVALSGAGRRHGWRAGRPGPVNLLGLLPLAAGGGLLAWAIASHYRAAPDQAEVTLVPTYLVDG